VARGLLNLAQAGRYLRIARQTFHRWAKGYERGKPLLHTRRNGDGLPITFTSLTEAHVLYGLRDAGVRLHKIRPALEQLQKEFGREYVLLAPELATDGVDVLWDYSRSGSGDSDLIVASSRQVVFREIVKDSLRFIQREPDGTPEVLELRHGGPSKIIVDVRRRFGQPIFAGSGVRVADVAGMLKAGEDPDVIADEFGIGPDEVRTAARILLGRAT
jgi:uncharacterized protein (DUF433 family)